MRRLYVLLLLFFTSSCSYYVLSRDIMERAKINPPLRAVQGNIEQYRDTLIVWGGTVVETVNTPEGSVMELVQIPVDRYGYIVDTDTSYGRYLAIFRGFLDPTIFKKGRHLTVAGRLAGSRTKLLGKMEYIYPLIDIREFYIWKKEELYYLNQSYIPPAYPYVYPYQYPAPYAYPYKYCPPDWTNRFYYDPFYPYPCYTR